MEIKTQEKFGRWKIIEPAQRPSHIKTRGRYYLCECSCEKRTRKIVSAHTLRNGTSQSCGCTGAEKNKRDETGKIYGKWIVVKQTKKTENEKNRFAYFLCRCQCGKESIVSGVALRGGHSTNCGCQRNEIREENAPYNSLYGTYKKSAIKRKIAFELTLDDFKSITQKNCKYCGVAPNGRLNCLPRHNYFVYNGIDRFNNQIGYVKENCVPCCSTCNTAKMAMSFGEFDDWLCRTYHHLHGI